MSGRGDTGGRTVGGAQVEPGQRERGDYSAARQLRLEPDHRHSCSRVLRVMPVDHRSRIVPTGRVPPQVTGRNVFMSAWGRGTDSALRSVAADEATDGEGHGD